MDSWRFILDVNTFKRMDRKTQTDNMLNDVVRKEFTQSMAKNDAENRQDHLCTRSLETRKNDVMHVTVIDLTTYVLVTCFYFTHAKLVTNMFCVHVWARQVSLLYVPCSDSFNGSGSFCRIS